MKNNNNDSSRIYNAAPNSWRKRKTQCSYITQETVPTTLLEVATAHQQTVRICATDTWKYACRAQTPYALVSQKLGKKTKITRSQYELTKMKNIKLILLACFLGVTRCWLKEGKKKNTRPLTSLLCTSKSTRKTWVSHSWTFLEIESPGMSF